MDEKRANLITGVSSAYRSMAQRRGVLVPLTGSGYETTGRGLHVNNRKVMLAVDALRRQRQIRLGRLRNAGWEPMLLGQRFNYSLNCPPFSVFTQNTRRPCRFAHWCPMCWARMLIGDAYDRLEFFYYGSSRNKRFCPNNQLWMPVEPLQYDLVEVITTSRHPVEALGELGPRVSQERGYFFKGHRAAGETRWIVPPYPCLGGLSVNTIEPLREPGWLLTQRYLCVINNTQEDPGTTVPAGYTRRVRRVRASISREAISESLSRVLRYPVGLMVGDVEDTLPVLRQHKKTRFRSYFGVLRNGTNRSVQQQLAIDKSAMKIDDLSPAELDEPDLMESDNLDDDVPDHRDLD